MRALLAALVLAGCGGSASDVSNGTDGTDGAQGPKGDQGEQGIQGEPGPAGPSGAAYHWVDANGDAVTVGTELIHIDENGVVWDVDWLTATAITPDFDDEGIYGSAFLYFAETACGGSAYISLQEGIEERLLGIQRPFRVWGREDVYARSPNQAVLPSVSVASVLPQDGACRDLTTPLTMPVLALDETIAATPPDLTWSAPLHRE